jgi:cellulose synthase/poly-beta-1,6-N-acetylglucosamine synthase-like glycosyltransferase
VLAGECFAALLPKRRADLTTGGVFAIDVLIPAHNEELVLEATLAALRGELGPNDRVWVIADNCSDSTAAIARNYGVGMFERHDLKRRGKGYALDHAVRRLANDHRDVVVVLDADCQVTPGSLRRMAAAAFESQRPVQARYTMSAPASNRPGDVVSQLAVMVKNVVRPLGLSRLGLPCVLTGSGMAFPWAVIRGAHLASGNIVEDMKLSVDLLLEGHATMHCAEAEAFAVLPDSCEAVVSQRTRWEHGHLQTILSQTPRLLRAAVTQRRPVLLVSALDLAIPPLSLLVLAWGLIAGVSLVLAMAIGAWLPLAISSISGGLLMATTLMVNAAFNPSGSWKTLVVVPWYVATKIPIYLRFLVHRQTAWIRTARQATS